MSRRDCSSEIIALADQLGLGAVADPVDAILRHCRARIDRWVAEAGNVGTIGQLETLVTRRLQMVFEEARAEDDFDRIKARYAAGKKDFVFAAMRVKFEDAGNPTFGALVRRKNAAADAPDRYVAVIDCRGSKGLRRFFTRWHEIAHRLTTHADQGDPVYRSEHDPIERLMDEIAGQLGFYEPLFKPAFAGAHAGKELLTFDTVQAVIDDGFPEASFQATLNTCTRRLSSPVIYLEAAIGHKKEVRKRIENGAPGLSVKEEPPGQLRAVRVVANEAAHRENFFIPANMRVPESSVIRSLFEDKGDSAADNREDLGQWSDSKGNRLEARAVAVEARKVPDRVIAIVQPVEPVRRSRMRPQVSSLFSE